MLVFVFLCFCFIGGFVGFFFMFGVYQRWCCIILIWVQYFEKMFDMCGLIDDLDCLKVGKYCEFERVEIKKLEDVVQCIMFVVWNFINFFLILDKDYFYSLVFGVFVFVEVEIDVLCVEVFGKEVKKVFI